MGISIDMNRALTSESYAAQCIRSGKLTGSQRSQIAAQWGADKIKLWEAVDSTAYKIDDDDWNASSDAGRKKAEEETGHDGSKQNVGQVGLDATAALVNGTMAVAGSKIGKFMGKGIIGKGYNAICCNSKGTNLFGKKITNQQSAQKNLSDIVTVIIGFAEAVKYQLSKPNEDQHDAAMKLYNAGEGSGLLKDGQASLNEAQEIMQDATEQTTELTEEAEEINEDANEDIDDNKTNFDFFRKQYEYLKAKAQSGEELTPDEKQMLKELAPLMEEAAANISSAQDEASTALSDKSDEIAASQSDYDDGAETIAEVQGVTDFAEGFDSATRTMAYIEGFSQGITATTTGLAAARLATKGGLSFGATLAFAAMGAAAAIRLGIASAEQFKWAGEVGDEIDFREDTQDLGTETMDVYDEELDNFAGNLEIIDDLEVVVPEDTEIPNQPAVSVDSGAGDIDPLAAGAAGVNVDENNDDNNGDNNGGGSDPLAAGAAAQEVKTDEPKAEDDPKKDEDEKK